MTNAYGWIDFYEELADKLLPYRKSREDLIRKIRQVYKNVSMKLPKLESDNNPKDIDPFTIFGLFNKGLSNANRITIIKGMASEFGVTASIPDSFDGIPVLNNLKATFYWFQEDRGEHDIDNLWALFSAALDYAGDESDLNRQKFIQAYDSVLVQQGIRWNITMGLYWIRPNKYLNLDSRNRRYMNKPDNMSANVVADVSALREVPSAEKYLDLRDKCSAAFASGEYPYRSFPELSYNAWISSEEVNKKEKEESKSGKSHAAFLRWFAPVIQALRDLGGSATPAQTRQKIIENEQLSDAEVSETRGKNKVNKFENEVAFARSYLVSGGYIDNSVNGIWTLTDAGKTVDMTEELASEIFKKGAAGIKANKTEKENALGDADVETVHYWLYAPGRDAVKWDDFYQNDIMGLGWDELGDLNAYASKSEISDRLRELNGDNSSYKNSAYATWQFCHDLKVGDIIFAKRGRTEILGRGVVTSDYEYDENQEDGYPNIRKVTWTHKGSWHSDEVFAMKTLTDITNYTNFVEKISAFFEGDVVEDEEEEEVVKYPPYTVEEFLGEVYISEKSYHDLVDVLRNKMNIILQGPPGVGKTYLAKRLAYSIMGEKDVERVAMVQFHQSYSYEDFIMGFRPSSSGFELRKGAFYNFCKKAEVDSDHDYFFIIDEINRGNLSKIFGELFMLIENDKRGSKNKLQLLYSDEMFFVPDNVYLIGMMNTADRSLAMMDYALRRRFAFFDLKPGFNSEGFRAYRSELDNSKFDRLIQCIENLNDHIAADDSLGEGFCIGHSYFCNMKTDDVTDERLSSIVEYEIIPILKEYWFDEPLKVREWSDTLRSVIK